jgi:hypothetical protein
LGAARNVQPRRARRATASAACARFPRRSCAAAGR